MMAIGQKYKKRTYSGKKNAITIKIKLFVMNNLRLD
jgi:hypothetical protein